MKISRPRPIKFRGAVYREAGYKDPYSILGNVYFRRSGFDDREIYIVSFTEIKGGTFKVWEVEKSKGSRVRKAKQRAGWCTEDFSPYGNYKLINKTDVHPGVLAKFNDVGAFRIFE